MFAQRPDRQGKKYFSYNYYTCTNPFIHLLGSLVIQWMIVRINRREEPKHDLHIRLGEEMLRLGRPESAKNLGLGSPRCSDLRLGKALHLGVHSYA